MLRGPACSDMQLKWDVSEAQRAKRRQYWIDGSTEKQYTCTLGMFHANVCTAHTPTWSLKPQFRWKQQTFIPCGLHQHITFLVLSTTEMLGLHRMKSSSRAS